jgi:hypothetical protein
MWMGERNICLLGGEWGQVQKVPAAFLFLPDLDSYLGEMQQLNLYTSKVFLTLRSDRHLTILLEGRSPGKGGI